MTDIEAVESLTSHECPACNRRKQQRHSLCRSCYFKLPGEHRERLYSPVGHGYTEAINEAIEKLKGVSA